MPGSDPSREEAIRRLDEQAAALEARTTREVPEHGAKAAGYGYRIMALLLGGVFVGLGFGAVVDFLVDSAPWGMIVGVLGGFAISIWMAVRSARIYSAEAARDWGPPRDLPDDAEDEDD
jgi:ATP synthase protein I